MRCLDARVVKGVDLRSTGLQAAWVRTPLQALIFAPSACTEGSWCQKWGQSDSNAQPSDLESDALPLRHSPINEL